MSYRLLFGDLHLSEGTDAPLKPGEHPYAWLARAEAEQATALLRSLLNLLELLGPAQLAEAVLDAATEEAGLKPTDKIKMPSNLFGGEDVAIGDIRRMYANSLPGVARAGRQRAGVQGSVGRDRNARRRR